MRPGKRLPSDPCYYRRLRLQSGYCITLPQAYMYELGWNHGTLLKITKEDGSIILKQEEEKK